MRKSAARNNKTLPIALTFSTAVFVIVFLSFFVRFFTLISEGKFDTSHQFVLVLEKNTHTGEMFIFTPETHTYTKITVLDANNSDHIGREIGVPVDTYISQSQNDTIFQLLQQHMLSFSSRDNLAWIDAVKLWWYIHNVKPGAQVTFTLRVKGPMPPALSQLLIDKSLFDENKTIAIVNDSGLSGRGSNLAQLLESIGANVVSVTSGQDMQRSQIVTLQKDSYTAKRLEKILGMPLQASMPRPAIADIVIIIGKDAGESAIF